jgi:glycosyltransferase involved in cell wall biosynthesis
MALGLPVITTDVPGCRDLVDDGLNGIVVPPRNAEALAAAMTRFIVQPELRLEMGRQSRLAAERKFDAGAINAQIIAALETL